MKRSHAARSPARGGSTVPRGGRAGPRSRRPEPWEGCRSPTPLCGLPWTRGSPARRLCASTSIVRGIKSEAVATLSVSAVGTGDAQQAFARVATDHIALGPGDAKDLLEEATARDLMRAGVADIGSVRAVVDRAHGKARSPRIARISTSLATKRHAHAHKRRDVSR